MKSFPDETGFYIQLLHSIFGIGGLIGPFIVAMFGLKSYFVLGIAMTLSSVIFLFLENPESK
jgi:hypothetical protein